MCQTQFESGLTLRRDMLLCEIKATIRGHVPSNGNVPTIPVLSYFTC